MGVIYMEKLKVHPRQSKKSMFTAHFWWVVEIWSVGEVNLVVNFLEEKSAPQRK